MLPTLLSQQSNGVLPFIGDRLFSDIDHIFSTTNKKGTLPLTLDLYEGPDTYHIRVMLPGISKENLEVTTEANVLTIEVKDNKNKNSEEKRNWRVLVKECICESGIRKITLPEDADLGTIEAVQKDGVLSIDIKKRPEAMPKRIAIK